MLHYGKRLGFIGVCRIKVFNYILHMFLIQVQADALRKSFCKEMKANPTNPELDCKIGTQERRVHRTQHQQLLKSVDLENTCKISCALHIGTRKEVCLFVCNHLDFHHASVLQLGGMDGRYNQTSYQHSQESRRLWTSHLLCPPSLTIQSH